jgi:NADH:ubiquinone oxidoreductase subunit
VVSLLIQSLPIAAAFEISSSSSTAAIAFYSLTQGPESQLTYHTGLDLEGNTYWEFRDTLFSQQGRLRRIVQYPPSLHYSDVTSKISPSWHQWLRHTRPDPPSLTEQSQDLVRQRNLKILAAQADERWNAKKSYLDAPADIGRTGPALGEKAEIERRRLMPQHPVLGGQAVGSIYAATASETGIRRPEPEEEIQPSETQQPQQPLRSGQRIQIPGEDHLLIPEKSPLRSVGEYPEVPGEETGNETLRKYGKDPWKQAEKTKAQASEPQAWDPNAKSRHDPWKKAMDARRGGAGEDWQPSAWNPDTSKPKR